MSRGGQGVILRTPGHFFCRDMERGRRWCFTWFDPESVPPEWDPTWMSYLIVGSENCPDTGRQHWQGYVESTTKVSLSTIKTKGGLWATCHLEKAQGTSEDNIKYCSKDGQEITWGEPMQAGKRTDLAALASAVTAGTTTVAEILSENPAAYHTYGRTLEKLEDLRHCEVTRGEWEPPNVHWYWGETGCGKSRCAMIRAKKLIEEGRAKAVYRHTWDDNGWWDCYKGEDIVIFDEFRCQIPFHQLLTWLDGYEVRVKRRGRLPVPLMAKFIIITCTKEPENCYDKDKIGEDMNQLIRRITQVRKFNRHDFNQ